MRPNLMRDSGHDNHMGGAPNRPSDRPSHSGDTGHTGEGLQHTDDHREMDHRAASHDEMTGHGSSHHEMGGPGPTPHEMMLARSPLPRPYRVRTLTDGERCCVRQDRYLDRRPFRSARSVELRWPQQGRDRNPGGLSPAIGAALMSVSTIIVAVNARLLSVS